MKNLFVILLGGLTVLLLSSGLVAQVEIGIGLRGGLTRVEDPIGSGPMFGGHLTLKATPKIHLETMVEYFSSSFEENQQEVSWKNLYVGATASYNVNLPRSPLTPYLGIGMCVHRITQTFNTKGTGNAVSSDESSLEGCFHVLGGLRLSFSNSPVQIFAEGRFMAVGDDETPNLAAVVAGFTFTFFKQ